MANEIEKREKQEVGTTAAENINEIGTAYRPDVDIYSSDTEIVFIVDLPGVAKGDVKILIDETDSLIIRAQNRSEIQDSLVLQQYNNGNYYRAFQLSKEYDKDKISAKFENGLLEITVPIREELKPKRIEINA